MLELPDDWVWDFWLAEQDGVHHLFFLKAPRSLGDPDLRHHNASVGHATSRDLSTWTRHPDALRPGSPGSFDDVATWTGSVVRDPRGGWRMFTSGVNRAGDGIVQRIGWADSEDLETWMRPEPQPVLAPDYAYYEQLGGDTGTDWFDEAWRDPWVYRAGDGDWHMLITARARRGSPDARGVIGLATSPDLDTWTVRPPLSDVEGDFGQLEVTQLAFVQDRPVLLFSCLTGQLGDARRERGERGGIWAVTVDPAQPDGPYDIANAYLLADESLYVGRLVQHDGAWKLLAFRNLDDDHEFVGAIIDPLDVEWDGDRLRAVTGGGRLDAATPDDAADAAPAR